MKKFDMNEKNHGSFETIDLEIADNYKTAVENHRHREHVSARYANPRRFPRRGTRTYAPVQTLAYTPRNFWIIWHVVVHVIIQIDVEI